MGLDSWLWLRQRVCAHQASEEDTFAAVCSLMDTTPHAVEEFSHTFLGFVALEVAYWRNAHLIHAWIEDCLRYTLPSNVWSAPLTRKELKRLLNVCHTLLAHPEQASQLLPLGVHYEPTLHARQFTMTATMLEFILGHVPWANETRFEFIYQSCW
jgi:hypothetical protein